MSDFPKKAEDKVNTFGIVLIGLASTALTWASVVALQAYYQSTYTDVQTSRNAERMSDEVRTLKASQLAALNRREYADASKGKLKRLPIERAMAVVVRDAQEGADSLVPLVGPHDVDTIPPVPGKPPEGSAVAPAADASASSEGEEEDGAQVDESTGPVEGDASDAPPADGNPTGGAAPATEATAPRGGLSPRGRRARTGARRPAKTPAKKPAEGRAPPSQGTPPAPSKAPAKEEEAGR